MPVVQFLATRDGGAAVLLSPLSLTPEQISLEGLQKAFLEQTNQHAFILHDGGLSLGVDSERYLVRLEGNLVTARDPYPPLEHARAWQQPGWFRETLAWLSEVLGEQLGTTEQISTNDLACVLRVKTEQRTVYLKASETGLEATLTARLATQHPGLTPNVIAWDEQHGVLVTQDCGVRLSEAPELALWNTAVTKLAHFQRQVDTVMFQKLGCPVNDFATLANQTEGFLRDTDILHNWGLTEAQTSRLQKQLPRIIGAYKRVSALNLSPLPAHGDAHPMNALTGCTVVWFDLSEACIAHPLLDMGWFLAWLSHPARHMLPLRQRYPDAAAELWQTYLRASDLPDAAPLLNDAIVLALIHRTLVHHERFRGWQGTVSDWRPQYVPYFLRSLLKLL